MKKLLFLSIFATLLFAGGGDVLRYQVLFDRFELQKSGTKVWDVSAYAGYNVNKLYLYSEGEDSSWQNEIVLSHAISPFWDIQAGIEVDHENKSKAFGEVTLSGLAPYWIEMRTKLLFGQGAVGVDFDFEYDTLFTQRLILNSRIESRWMSKNIEAIGVGEGLNYVEAGFRLRYEIRREFAPYIGVSFKRNFGQTKRIVCDQSESSLLMGVRFWF